MKQLKRNLLSTAVLPAVAGAVLAVGFAAVPCGRAAANSTYASSGQANPEAVPMPSDMRGMNAGCCGACGAACAACNPCAAANPCNPCAAADPCNPCGIDPCAACNACCGASLETERCNAEAVPA